MKTTFVKLAVLAVSLIFPIHGIAQSTAADYGNRGNASFNLPGALVTLPAIDLPPFFTTQPADKAVKAGQTAMFPVRAAGLARLIYQ